MTFISFIFILISCILLCKLPLNKAIIPVIIATTLIPVGSAIQLGPASFSPMRILALIGMLRVISKGELNDISFNKVDKLVVFWAIVMIVTGFLQPDPDTSIMFRFGEAYGTVFIYFLLRVLITSHEDLILIFKVISVIFFVIAVIMFYEKVKKYNFFSLLGGVPSYPVIRDGKIRCQGPFGISILAGTVPATSIGWILYQYLLKDKKSKYFLFLGFFSALGMICLSTSSGPIMSLIFTVIGLAAWKIRYHMRFVRWSILLILIILQFIMKQPVWYIISKIDLTGSSTGWHRSELIDKAVKHFDEWWLVGTGRTRHWMPYGITWSERHVDITNQYIKNGIWGGLLTMWIFIKMIIESFRIIGRKLDDLRYFITEDSFLVWVLGATLFSHTITFLSIRYFDQTMFYFYMLLAMIGTLEKESLRNKENVK